MYDIIVNPIGGKGKSLKALKEAEEVLKAHGALYTVHNTEYAGHATEIARELSRKPDTKLIVMGGDGSFNEVLNGIENFDNVTLGIVACGTGNDFIRASGHPSKRSRARRNITLPSSTHSFTSNSTICASPSTATRWKRRCS